jgi:hypothetical protein
MQQWGMIRFLHSSFVTNFALVIARLNVVVINKIMGSQITALLLPTLSIQ